MNTVFIIDDHDIVRYGLEMLVGSSGSLKLVGSASSLEDGLLQIGRLKPDLVISDMSLDDSRGLDTVRSVVLAQQGRRVLVVSMHDEELFGEQVLGLGAHGYLMKEKAHACCVPAALEILAGRTWVSPALNSRLLNRLLRHAPALGRDARRRGVEPLSARELEVLVLLGAGKTTKEIAGDLDLSARTVDIHRSNLKRKLGLRTAAELIAYSVTHS